MAVAMIVIADLVPPSQRGAYIGPLAGMFAVSSVVGPLLGGFLTDGPGWRVCFWLNLPIGAVCSAVVAAFLPSSLGRLHLRVKSDGADPAAPDAYDVGTIDYAGIFTIIASVVLLCLALTWGGTTYAWSSATIVALLVVAAVTLAAFVAVEARVRDPIMPLALFKRRNFAVSAVVSLLTGFVLTGCYVFLPLFFQYVLLQSASGSGVSMVPLMLGLPVGAMITGALVTLVPQLGYRFHPAVGSLGLVIANYLFSTLSPTTTQTQIVGYLILGGLSMGPGVQVPLLSAQNAVGPKFVAVASSSMQFFQSIGGLLSTAICQTLMNNRLAANLVAACTTAFVDVAANGAASVYADAHLPDACGPLADRHGVTNPVLQALLAAAFSDAIARVFLVTLAGAAACAVAACFGEHVPLTDGAPQAPKATSADAAPADAASAGALAPAAALVVRGADSA